MITKTVIQHCENCGLSCKDFIGKNIEVRPLSGGIFEKKEQKSKHHPIHKQSNEHLPLLGNGI